MPASLTAPPASPALPEPSVEPVLRTVGLTKCFGKFAAVRDLQLTVRPGEIYGFLGRNGAGKTTTIRMLMGILSPDAGHLEWMGRTLRRPGKKEKQSIGYVSQEQHFYPWMTCLGLGRFVGGFYPTWDMEEFRRLLRALDLPPDRRFSRLSGGMRVKLALALALAHRPSLLLLDEPTSSLDPVARREFVDMIRGQARTHQRTTFFSTHRIEEVEQAADRIGIIHQGSLRFEGDIPTLLASLRRLRWDADAAEPPPPPLAGGPPPLPSERDPAAACLQGCPEAEILRRETPPGGASAVVRAPATFWESFAPPPGTACEPVSLEDAFIALAGGSAAQL